MDELIPFSDDEDDTPEEPQFPVVPFDPSSLGFPVMLPVELALRDYPVREICEGYEIDRDAFERICKNPVFQKAYEDAVKMLQIEGMSYRLKARMQAEELLKTSWEMIHDKLTPAAVRADLIKHTAKVAGLEPKEQSGSGSATPLQINILMGDYNK